MQISFRYFDYVVVFFRHENGDDVGAVRIHDGGKGNAQGKGNHGTFKHAAANASDHAGAEILRNVGCHRDAERYHRLGGQLFDPHGRSEGGNGVGAERIADALGDGGADGDDGKLDGHRHGDFKVLFAELPVQFPVFFLRMKNRIFFADVKQAAKDGNRHCADGAESRTGNAQLHAIDENDIKSDVEQGGEYEEVERRFAVSQRPHETRQKVEENDHDDAVGNDADEGFGVLGNFLRHVHDLEQNVERGQHDGAGA